MVWVEGGRPPFHKCPPAHHCGDPSFSCAAKHDRCALAKRFCSSSVRYSPLACGIGRLGGGTQGRAERCFLYVNPAGVRPLRARAVDRPLFDGGIRVCPWSDVQTNAGDAAVRAFAPGLLAAE